MKRRSHIYHVVVLLTLAFACLTFGSSAMAQEIPQSPFLAPTPPSLLWGRFWFQAGTKYRWIETFRFEFHPFNVGGAFSNNEILVVFDENIFTPYLETGYQHTNFFDIWFNFSYFELNKPVLKNLPVTLPDGTVTLGQVFNRFEANVYEFGTGGRSWFPIWGFGRIGASLGVLLAPMPYRVFQSVNTPGVVVISNSQFDTFFWNTALMTRLDLEFDFACRFFVKGSIEYDWYFSTLKWGDNVNNTLNIGGRDFCLSAGIRF